MSNKKELQTIKADQAWWEEAFGVGNLRAFTFRDNAHISVGKSWLEVNTEARDFFFRNFVTRAEAEAMVLAERERFANLVDIASHIADAYALDDDDLHTLRAAIRALKGDQE